MLKQLLNKLVGNKVTKEVRSVPVNQNTQNNHATIPTPKIKPPVLDTFNFNVAGVTAKNEQNLDIQKVLQKNGKLYAKENDFELYGGYKNKEIIEDRLEVGEFEDLYFTQHEVSFVPEPTNKYDSNAIKVFIKYDETPVNIGYVPKKNNVELKNILDNEDVRRIEARYVGGKIKSADYDEEEYKDIVVIAELTLGVEIQLFYKKGLA